MTAAVIGGNVDALQQLLLTALGATVGGTFSFIKTVAQERLAILSRGEHEE